MPKSEPLAGLECPGRVLPTPLTAGETAELAAITDSGTLTLRRAE
jgi:hypothetical protein